jgi:hypothetical protein
MDLMDAAAAPFTIALMVMALIAALELAGLLFGVAFSGLVDSLLPEADGDIDVDGGDAIGRLFAWLYVGKVPVLIVAAAFLAGFGLSGLLIQSVAAGAFGAPLPLGAATPFAFLAAMPATRALAGGVHRIMPREETDAVSTESFIGRVAEVIRGEARRGGPAEAKLTDANAQTHYILVEPEDDADRFATGDEILLTEKKGAVFRGVRNENPALSPKKKGEEDA